MKGRRIIVVLFAVSLFFAGCSGPDGGQQSRKIVKTAVVEPSVQHKIAEFPGRVIAAREVNMAFKVSGTLQRIIPDEGDFVKKGEIIAIMDDRDYQLQYNAAKAEYANVKAQAERVFTLYADSAATPQAFDNAKYGLAQIEAKYENSKNQLSYTRLSAPFDCYIQKHIMENASVVGAGMPVVTVISASVPEVEINIPASEFADRDNFSEFSATFDFMPGERMALEPVSISPKANANQLYTMKLRFADGRKSYPSPGMNTLVEIVSYGSDSLYTSIPSAALFSQNGKSRVWVLEDGCVHSREVVVSSLNLDGKAIVSSGLETGEQIVSAGVHKLHEGESVQVMDKPSETNVGGLL